MAQDSFGNFVAGFTPPPVPSAPPTPTQRNGYEGSGPPTLVPEQTPAFYIDTDDNTVYWYSEGEWKS